MNSIAPPAPAPGRRAAVRGSRAAGRRGARDPQVAPGLRRAATRALAGSATTLVGFGDINGDGQQDLVGCRDVTYLSLGLDSVLRPATQVSTAFGTGSGWGRDHPRMLADVDGDGRDDLIGFGSSGVYVVTRLVAQPYGSGCSVTLLGDVRRASPTTFELDLVALGPPGLLFGTWVLGGMEIAAPLPGGCELLADPVIVGPRAVAPTGLATLSGLPVMLWPTSRMTAQFGGLEVTPTGVEVRVSPGLRVTF